MVGFLKARNKLNLRFKKFELGIFRVIVTNNLLYFIELLEKELGIKSIKEFKPMEPGDLINTSASISSLNDWVGYKSKKNIDYGVKSFVNWYLEFYKN